MLQSVSRCRPVCRRVWFCLLGLGIFTWTLPTVWVDSVLAQSPLQQTDTIQPISKTEIKLIDILESLEDENAQPVPAGKPNLNSIEELPEVAAHQNANKLSTGFLDPPVTSTNGVSLDLVRLMNSYFEASKKLRGSGVTLKQMQQFYKRGAITLSELQSWQTEIETARRKTELIRKITSVARESAGEELKLLSSHKKLVEQRYKAGETGIEKLLAVQRRELQVRSNIKILELLTESMNAAKTKKLQPQPEKPREPQTKSSTTKSNSEIEKTIQARLGLSLSEAGIPPALSQTKYRGGLRVREVVKDGPADKSGIRKGDILVGLHFWETTSFEDVDHVLSKPYKFQDGRLKFYMFRNGNTWFGVMQIVK